MVSFTHLLYTPKRRPRGRTPDAGASTVRKKALYPAFSALRIMARDCERLLETYSYTNSETMQLNRPRSCFDVLAETVPVHCLTLQLRFVLSKDLLAWKAIKESTTLLHHTKVEYGVMDLQCREYLPCLRLSRDLPQRLDVHNQL